MSYWSYLKSSYLNVFIVAATAMLCCFMLVVAGTGLAIALLVAALIVFAGILESVTS